MYYKCADQVIFLLDLSSEENLNVIKQNYFHIRNKLTQKNLKFLLIGLEKGICNEKNYRKANDFAEENKFLGFLLYKPENSLIKETVKQIIIFIKILLLIDLRDNLLIQEKPLAKINVILI